MGTTIEWHTEFAKIIACTRCTAATDRNLLRDNVENVPQPGFVGSGYERSHVLLVGQNPGTPKTLAHEDLPYTAALRALRDQPTPERYKELTRVMARFIPTWPVHGNYFPLVECGLTLDDIAYCNAVRCRTTGDKPLTSLLVQQCVDSHFGRWIDLLKPRVVVFIGKRAWEGGRAVVERSGIPNAFMNRQRSLSTDDRVSNRAEVVALVKQHRG